MRRGYRRRGVTLFCQLFGGLALHYLNLSIRKSRRKTRFTRIYRHNTSLKDCIESCGVPHTEVDLILVNGVSADFDQLINSGDASAPYKTMLGGLHQTIA